MKQFGMALVLAVTGILLGGCVESKDTYVLNPDGSGKVTRIVIFQPKTGMPEGMSMGEGMSPEKKKKPEEEVQEAGRMEIEQSEGIEVWKDARSYRAKDGRICFLGTAYFKNLSKIKLHNGGFAMDQKPVWTKAADGTGVLEFKSKKKGDAAKPAVAKPAPKTMTDNEVQNAIANGRSEYQSMAKMMEMALSSMKMFMSFALPGKVESSMNFKRDKAGNPCVSFLGTKILEAMDAIIKDDKWMEQQVRAGVSFGMGEGPDMDDILNEKLFGEKGPIRAKVAAGGAPLFDYAKEVATAKAAYPALLKQFGAAGAGGLTMEEEVASVPGEALKNVRVEEVSIVKDENRVPTVRLLADFTGTTTGFEEGMLEKAVANNGEKLSREKEYERTIMFPRLKDDKKTVTFDVSIERPSAAVTGIKVMSGYLVYGVSKETKMVDLGIRDLSAGTGGTEYRAKITKIDTNSWSPGKQTIQLEMAINKGAIKSVKLSDDQGKDLPVESCTINGFTTKAYISLDVKGTLPKTGRITAEIHQDIKKFKAPFIIHDVALPKEKKETKEN